MGLCATNLEVIVYYLKCVIVSSLHREKSSEVIWCEPEQSERKRTVARTSELDRAFSCQPLPVVPTFGVVSGTYGWAIRIAGIYQRMKP